jgi:hypothetical protein
MSASTNDKITDVRNAARPNSARVTSGRSAAGATLACDNLSGWPTASKVHFVTYKIDSNSDVVAGTQLDCYGIVSGNNLGSFTVVDGTDVGHAVGDVVEMLPTAAWGQDLADALSVGHTRTGAHAANLPLTTPILTTPTIADFTSATHTHANNAGGGQLTGSAIATGAQIIDKTLNPYKFSVYRSGAWTTNSSAALVTFDTKTFDTGTNYDTSTGKFTAPIAGFYHISAAISFTQASGGVSGGTAFLYKNGSAINALGGYLGAAAAWTGQASGGTLVQLAASDYLQIFFQAGGATSATGVTGVSNTYFTGFLVSAT